MNILIYGTGTGAQKLLRRLNFDKCKILAYIDRDINAEIRFINEIKVISREEICKYNYDYIFIASEYKEIYDILINQFGVNEYRLIPVFFKAEHYNIHRLILNDILNIKEEIISIEIEKDDFEEKKDIEEFYIDNYYIRNKTILESINILDLYKVIGDIYLIGIPDIFIINLLIKINSKRSIYILHSIEESFKMKVINKEQKDFVEYWEKKLEDEMKWSKKTILSQISNLECVNYNFGLYEKILNININHIAFLYIEVDSIESIQIIIDKIYESLTIGGYIFLYNPNLTQKSFSSIHLIELINNKYKNLNLVPSINSKFGMLFCKIESR